MSRGRVRAGFVALALGTWDAFAPPVIQALANRVPPTRVTTPFPLGPVDLSQWNETYLNGSIRLVGVAACVLAGLVLCVAGVTAQIRGRQRPAIA